MPSLANLRSDHISIVIAILVLEMPAAIAQAFTSDGKFIEPTIIADPSPYRTGQSAHSSKATSAETALRIRIEKEQAVIYFADRMNLQKTRTPPEVLLDYAQFSMEIGRRDLAQKFFRAMLAVLDDCKDSKFKEVALDEYQKFVEPPKQPSGIQPETVSSLNDPPEDTAALQTNSDESTNQGAVPPEK